MDDFSTLGCLFLSQFLATRKRKKNPAYMLSLVQGKDESLKGYMLKFNREKLTVESPNEQIVLLALMNGVRAEGPLMAEIAKKSMLLTLRQFLNKSEEYINQEETVGALMKSQKEAAEGGGSSNKIVPESSGKKKEEKNPKKPGRKANPTFSRIEPLRHQGPRLTPLKTRVTEVFMEIRRDLAFRWPTRMRTPAQKRNNQKFCEYHNDHDHLTEECITLR